MLFTFLWLFGKCGSLNWREEEGENNVDWYKYVDAMWSDHAGFPLRDLTSSQLALSLLFLKKKEKISFPACSLIFSRANSTEQSRARGNNETYAPLSLRNT